MSGWRGSDILARHRIQRRWLSMNTATGSRRSRNGVSESSTLLRSRKEESRSHARGILLEDLRRGISTPRLRVLFRESTPDGTEPPIFRRPQASYVVLSSASGCDPCDALVDVAAGRFRSEEAGCVVGYLVFGAVAECSVHGSVPGCATVGLGGPFTERIGDPFGWLVSDGCESVSVSVVGFVVQVQVLNEQFALVINGG